jgi:hypothetical protein
MPSIDWAHAVCAWLQAVSMTCSMLPAQQHTVLQPNLLLRMACTCCRAPAAHHAAWPSRAAAVKVIFLLCQLGQVHPVPAAGRQCSSCHLQPLPGSVRGGWQTRQCSNARASSLLLRNPSAWEARDLQAAPAVTCSMRYLRSCWCAINIIIKSPTKL